MRPKKSDLHPKGRSRKDVRIVYAVYLKFNVGLVAKNLDRHVAIGPSLNHSEVLRIDVIDASTVDIVIRDAVGIIRTHRRSDAVETVFRNG